MTEPDEAVWFIREREAHAQGYRAGQAASAERIKALEAFLRHLRQWDQMNPPMTGDHAAHAASIDALLEEADR